MWNELLAAVALLLVLEGILPFVNPRSLRQTMQQMANLPDRILRAAGLISMLCGAMLLYVVRQIGF